MGLTVAIFRLPGIYGPGRSALRPPARRRGPADRQRPARSSPASTWTTWRRAWRPPSPGPGPAGSTTSATTSRRPTARSSPMPPSCWACPRRRRSRWPRPGSRRRRSASTPRASASPTRGPRPSSAGGRAYPTYREGLGGDPGGRTDRGVNLLRSRSDRHSSTAAISRARSCGRDSRWSPSLIRVKTTSSPLIAWASSRAWRQGTSGSVAALQDAHRDLDRHGLGAQDRPAGAVLQQGRVIG